MKSIAAVSRVVGVRQLLLYPLLAVLLLVLARTASAQLAGTSWRDCANKAFTDYNSCLMESSGWFHQKVCDIAFEGDIVWCSAKYAGEVRNAWNGR